MVWWQPMGAAVCESVRSIRWVHYRYYTVCPVLAIADAQTYR